MLLAWHGDEMVRSCCYIYIYIFPDIISPKNERGAIMLVVASVYVRRPDRQTPWDARMAQRVGRTTILLGCVTCGACVSSAARADPIRGPTAHEWIV